MPVGGSRWCEERRRTLAVRTARGMWAAPKRGHRWKRPFEFPSLGKPVVFYCNEEQRSRFYREVHPLSRLIEFETGIAVGAMVTDSLSEVSELLHRIFENKMEYRLEHTKKGYLKLKETLTGSVVRLQTSDQMLSETFWNHYYNRDFALRR